MMMRINAKHALLAGSSVLALGLSSLPAAAQSAAAAPDPLAQSAEQSVNQIDDIIVTAQRRSERLQDVPSSIFAVDSEALERAGIESTKDIQLVAPALTFAQVSFAPAPNIRGIGTSGASPGDEQSVPVYIDGVYQPFLVGGLFELNNIERIEVLNGPQGTLLGRNATGGAVNIITAAPSFAPEGHATIGFGSFERREVSLYGSAGAGNVAASLSASAYRDDGYVRELTLGRNTASLESYMVRGKVLVQFSENTELTASIGYSDRTDSRALAVIPLNGNSRAGAQIPGGLPHLNRYEAANSPQFEPESQIEQFTASLVFTHDFENFRFTSVSGYNDSKIHVQSDSDASPLYLQYNIFDQTDRSFVQEAYLTSSREDRFKWIVGAFYMNGDVSRDPFSNSGSFTSVFGNTEAYAVYAQGSYEITDALELTVGGRYSHDTKSAIAYNPARTRTLDTSADFSSFNPSVTLAWRVNDDLNTYVKYSTAYKSGLINALTFATTPVGKEEVEAYEIGFKSSPAPWLRFNAAAYHTNYTDIQINARDPVTNQTVLQNAASATIYGSEMEAIARLSEGLNLRANLALIRAQFDSFPGAIVQVPVPGGGNAAVFQDASGRDMPRVPRYNASLGADYTTDVGQGTITVSGNVYFAGRYYWQADSRLQQPSRTDVNARIAWSPTPNYTVTVYGDNLMDSYYYQSIVAASGGDLAYVDAPRSFGIKLTARY